MVQAADACPCQAAAGGRVLQSAVLPQGAGVCHSIVLPHRKPRCLCTSQSLPLNLARQTSQQGVKEACGGAATRPDHEGCAGSNGISNSRCGHAWCGPTQHCRQQGSSALHLQDQKLCSQVHIGHRKTTLHTCTPDVRACLCLEHQKPGMWACNCLRKAKKR